MLVFAACAFLTDDLISIDRVETVLAHQIIEHADVVSATVDAIALHPTESEIVPARLNVIASLIASRFERHHDDLIPAIRCGSPYDSEAAVRATLVLLRAIISVNVGLVESSFELAATTWSATSDIPTLTTVAGLLFDPNQAQLECRLESRRKVMRMSIAAALSLDSHDLLEILLLSNRVLFCNCIAGDPLTSYVDAGKDPSDLFGVVCSNDDKIAVDICAWITNSDVAIVAVRRGNLRALLFLVENTKLPSEIRDGQALLDAMRLNSPFLAEAAKDPVVFGALLEIVSRIVDCFPVLVDHAALTQRLACELSVMQPLVGYGNTVESDDIVQMIHETSSKLGCNVYHLIQSGHVVRQAHRAGNYALICALVRVVATEGSMVDAMSNASLTSWLVTTRSPQYLLQLLNTLLADEVEQRLLSASFAMQTVEASRAVIEAQRGLPATVTVHITAAEQALLHHNISLIETWPNVIRRFLGNLDQSSTSAMSHTDQLDHIATIVCLLVCGSTTRLSVESVYTDPRAAYFWKTAFSHGTIACFIAESAAYSLNRHVLLEAWARFVRYKTIEGTVSLRGSLRIDRLSFTAPGKALDAVERIALVIEKNGGYGSLSLASFCGVFTSTMSGDQGASHTIRDVSIGAGAHREVALLLLRLIYATDAFDNRHFAGPVPKHGTAPAVLHLLGWLVFRIIALNMTVGKGCIAPAFLACMIGMPINVTRSFVAACPASTFDAPVDIDVAYSALGALTDGFGEEDYEFVRSCMENATHVMPENLHLFVDAVNVRVCRWSNMGQQMHELATGFAESISGTCPVPVLCDDSLMVSLRAILRGTAIPVRNIDLYKPFPIARPMRFYRFSMRRFRSGKYDDDPRAPLGRRHSPRLARSSEEHRLRGRI